MYFIIKKIIMAIRKQEGMMRPVVAHGPQACDYKGDRLWVRFLLEKMKYLILSFLRSDVQVKRVGEYCHLTRNSSRIRGKVPAIDEIFICFDKI